MIRPCVIGLLAVTCACPALVQSSGFLYENPAWYSATTPSSVKAVDLNGDGAPDLVAAGELREISVHLNLGDGRMGPPTFYATLSTQTKDLAVGDLNGDEFPDLAIASITDRVVQTFINDGAGGFTLRDTLTHPTQQFSGIAIGDPNGDGLGDLLGVQGPQSFLQLYIALPGGGFAPPNEAFLVNTPTNAEFGDANGDGFEDLFVVSSNGPNPVEAPGMLSVFVNGGFDEVTGDWLGYNTFAISNSVGVGAPRDLELSDLDGDGTLEVVVTTSLIFEDRGFAVVMPNAGGGVFGPPNAIEIPNDAQGLDIGDMDGDGRLDIVVANLEDSEFTVILQSPNSRGVSFGEIRSVVGARLSPIDVDLADLDSDGDLDVVLGSFAGDAINGAINDGTGHFGLNDRYSSGEEDAAGIVALDIDDDGDDDLLLLVEIFQGPKFVTIATNDGDGLFSIGPPLSIVNGRPRRMTGADMNGDGRTDAVYYDFVNRELNVLFNNGDGTLTPGAPFSSPSQSSIFGYTVFDSDGDGDLDIFTAGFPNGSTIDRNKLFVNDGAGSFTDTLVPISTGYGQELDASDLDGDGDLDLAILSQGGDVALIRNDGGNAFSALGTIPNPGSAPTGLLLRDFNGDGDADIALANNNSRHVAIILGNGAPFGFGTPATFGVNTQVNEPSAGDVDGDGDLDLIVHISGDVDALSILRNNGDGTFEHPEGFTALARMSGTALSDFNGDGRLDIAFGVNAREWNMFVMLQRDCDATPACPGDCDESGSVDFGDLVAMLGEFGTPGSVVGCDADESGTVNFGDLVTALGLFGPCP